MAIQNDFLPFAVGTGANVLSQSSYEVLSALSSGFLTGTAQSAACNKVWRQTTIMTAVIAQFIVQRTGQPAVDDGTTAALLANLLASTAALNGDSTQVFAAAAATNPSQVVTLGQLRQIKTIAVFTSNGSFTVPAGVFGIWITATAGGGGGGAGGNTTGLSSLVGGGGGGGGGAGQFLIRAFFAVTPGQVISITVGAGGFGGVAGGATATAGGNTVIGTLATLTGGNPGATGATATVNSTGGGGIGGNGGAGSPAGNDGSDGNYAGNGGAGGSSPLGGGGAGGRAAQLAGRPGSSAAPGGGGGGGGGCYGTGAGTAGNGGPGGQSYVLIEC
ncbi:phage tail protein [Burkholderia gladioli]|uniref:glycine-rich domain-containing protein n=1 Tax=Burkholderia gladioli TaxID=28095 RepID=UPI001C26CDE8|nr:phage tail protein [Burkholderia gladioli]